MTTATRLAKLEAGQGNPNDPIASGRVQYRMNLIIGGGNDGMHYDAWNASTGEPVDVDAALMACIEADIARDRKAGTKHAIHVVFGEAIAPREASAVELIGGEHGEH